MFACRTNTVTPSQGCSGTGRGQKTQKRAPRDGVGGVVGEVKKHSRFALPGHSAPVHTQKGSQTLHGA